MSETLSNGSADKPLSRRLRSLRAHMNVAMFWDMPISSRCLDLTENQHYDAQPDPGLEAVAHDVGTVIFNKFQPVNPSGTE